MGGRNSDFYCHFRQVLTARGFLRVRESESHCPVVSCAVMCCDVPCFLAKAAQNLSDNILSTQKSPECHLCLVKMPSRSDETAAAHQQCLLRNSSKRLAVASCVSFSSLSVGSEGSFLHPSIQTKRMLIGYSMLRPTAENTFDWSMVKWMCKISVKSQGFNCIAWLAIL